MLAREVGAPGQNVPAAAARGHAVHRRGVDRGPEWVGVGHVEERALELEGARLSVDGVERPCRRQPTRKLERGRSIGRNPGNGDPGVGAVCVDAEDVRAVGAARRSGAIRRRHGRRRSRLPEHVQRAARGRIDHEAKRPECRASEGARATAGAKLKPAVDAAVDAKRRSTRSRRRAIGSLRRRRRYRARADRTRRKSARRGVQVAPPSGERKQAVARRESLTEPGVEDRGDRPDRMAAARTSPARRSVASRGSPPSCGARRARRGWRRADGRGRDGADREPAQDRWIASAPVVAGFQLSAAIHALEDAVVVVGDHVPRVQRVGARGIERERRSGEVRMSPRSAQPAPASSVRKTRAPGHAVRRPRPAWDGRPRR